MKFKNYFENVLLKNTFNIKSFKFNTLTTGD